MSAKFTYLAWQQTNLEASHKLVLLKLADLCGQDGSVAVALADVAKECLLGEFGFADVLTALSQKGLLEKGRVESIGSRQIHHLTLSLSEPNSLPVIETSMAHDSQPKTPVVTTPQASSAPPWTYHPMNLYKVPVASRDNLWQRFIRERDVRNMNDVRRDAILRDWLEMMKGSGGFQEYFENTHSQNERPAPSRQRSSAPSNAKYISTHDLQENEIAEWAMQSILHSGMAADPHLFWEKFVVYYKARANEFLSVTQMLNKLRLWIVNEKQAEDRRRQADERRRQSFQQSQKSGEVSPSEEFREYLRGQGKNPNF
ncbi:hypothetical protein [Vibrio maritimus]|uniref:hypothetical protein n=1 Tax=Vibrio maritimus TaxID=990268 RepID=UPI003734CB83